MNQIIEYKFLFVLVFLILFFSCRHKNHAENSQVETIYADLKNASQIVMSDVFEKVEYVPLETKEKTLVNDIAKVIVNNNKIFVFQDELDKVLLVFDKNGYFEYKIDGFVEGIDSKRYYRVHDFIINQDSGQVEMIDAFRNRLVSYDIEDGKFHKYIPIDQSFQYGVKLEDNYILRSSDDCRSLNDYSLFKFNNTFVRQDSFIRNEKEICDHNAIGRFPFSNKLDNSYLFIDGFSPDIYRVRDSDVCCEYKFNPGGKFVSPEFIDQLNKINIPLEKLEFINRLRRDYVTNMDFIAETNSSIYITHFSGIGAYWNFYNKHDKKTKTFRLFQKQANNQNDIDKGMMFGIPRGFHENNILFLMYPYDVLNFYNQILNDEQREELAKNKDNRFYELVQKIDYYDNPIVVFAKLKEEFR